MSFQFTRPDPFPPIIKNLVIVNALVFLAQVVLDDEYHVTQLLALYPVDTPDFKPYQIATHMFAHSPQMIFHILFNMITLWMFGRILENYWGAKRFLFFYLVCGVGAAAAHLLIQHLRFDEALLNDLTQAYLSDDQATLEANAGKLGFLSPAVGASGAIMGVMAAFAYTFPNTELFIMFIPFPVKAKWAVIGLACIDLFGGVASISGDNIAHFAHLGGAITGFLLVLYWNKTNRQSLY
ncbi:MAG: rhomboid family intramembrane serine protease [Bacteroidota bacterium]